MTEEEHVALIGERLGVSLSKDQLVQSHTPYLDLVPIYESKNVLVIGGASDNIRTTAKHYGFQKLFTLSDFVLAFEGIHPFPGMTLAKHMEIADRSRADLLRNGAKIAAILVWSSPHDWLLGQQILLDLLRPTKDGGSPHRSPPEGGRPKLYVSNLDFEWATGYKLPRLAQGGFFAAFEAIWGKATKGRTKLEYVQYGKPLQATFEYGERALRRYNDRLNTKNGTSNRIKTVYMIGDNPESDIKGCNRYKSPFRTAWKSVLVETGVYRAGTRPTHTPTRVASSCKDAVEWALQDEGYRLP